MFVRQYRVAGCISVELELIEWERVADGASALNLESGDSLQAENCEHQIEAPDSKDVDAIIARIPADLAEVRSFSMLW